jgi:putative nucleotidyltransferase with HDIG domain
MVIINSANVFNMLRTAFNYVNPDLAAYSERVAYIVYCLLQVQDRYKAKKKQSILISALLHNIGAYKNDLAALEQKEGQCKEAIYGYLLLKYFSPLHKEAEAVLYHKIQYDRLAAFSCQDPEIPALINLANRVENMLQLGGIDYGQLAKGAGTQISPWCFQLLQQADNIYNIAENINNSQYKLTLRELLANAALSEVELRQYIELLAYFIELRSSATIKHTFFTVFLSIEIAYQLNLSLDDIEKIYYGAMLHDIGKIAIPLSVLEKRGTLTEEEKTIMRTHVDITDKILQNNIDPEVYQLAIRHHEKLNGMGYPAGLTADELTQNQRIIVFADMLSALQEERSYKARFDKRRVLSILRAAMQGGDICPDIFKVVESQYDVICMRAMDQYKEFMVRNRMIQLEFKQLYKKICT